MAPCATMSAAAAGVIIPSEASTPSPTAAPTAAVENTGGVEKLQRNGAEAG